MKKYIVLSKSDKFEILEAAKNAGFDLRISCPDGLASFEKGFRIVWYGFTEVPDIGERSQILVQESERISREVMEKFHKLLDDLSDPVIQKRGRYEKLR